METDDVVLRHVPRNLRTPSVLAAGLLAMLSLGIVYTFGNILPYLVSYMRWKVDPSLTTSSMIWLQTLMSGVPFSMLVGGVLERSLGGRTAALIGTTMYTSAIAFSYYAIQTSFAALMISFGFFSSFGSGIAYNAVLITAQRWMPEDVGLAGGIIVGGYGCGAFIMSPIQTWYVNPRNYAVNSDGYFTQEDLLERVPSMFLVMAALFVVLQAIGLVFIGDPKEVLSLDDEDDENRNLLQSSGAPSAMEMIKSWQFAMLFLTLMLNAVWCQLTSGLYKAFGQQFIPNDRYLSFIGSIASMFNCMSRVGWGVLADKTSYRTSMTINCTLGAVLMWNLPAIKYSQEDFFFMMAVCGMFVVVGGTYSLLPFATHKVFGKSHFGVVYGTVQMSLSCAGIIAGLLSQFLLPPLGYSNFFLAAGGFLVASLIITMLVDFKSFEGERRRSQSLLDGYE